MKIEGVARLELNVTVNLTESEARALRELAGYGSDAFVKHFYEKLGKSYMEPHEKGLRSLFASLTQLDPIFERMDAARKTWNCQSD